MKEAFDSYARQFKDFIALQILYVNGCGVLEWKPFSEASIRFLQAKAEKRFLVKQNVKEFM